MKPFASRTHQEMKEVLLHSDAVGPEIHYYMIRGGKEKSNITIWEPGCVGDEYIKSLGHYHVGALDETYTILAGEGIIIMQWRKKDEAGVPIDGVIEKFVAKKLKAGDQIFIPAEAGHLMVNTGPTWLVTSDNSPVNLENKDEASMPGHADYAPFRKLHGAGYYIVAVDGLPHLIKNPNYMSVPEFSLE